MTIFFFFSYVIKLIKPNTLKERLSKRVIFTSKRVKMKNNRVSMSSIAGKQNPYSLRNENSFKAAFLEGIHEASKAITMTVTATSMRSPIFNVTG